MPGKTSRPLQPAMQALPPRVQQDSCPQRNLPNAMQEAKRAVRYAAFHKPPAKSLEPSCKSGPCTCDGRLGHSQYLIKQAAQRLTLGPASFAQPGLSQRSSKERPHDASASSRALTTACAAAAGSPTSTSAPSSPRSPAPAARKDAGLGRLPLADWPSPPSAASRP